MSPRAPRNRDGIRAGRLAGAAVLALALTACGFHLRGNYRLSDALFPLHIDAPAGSAVARELRDTLRRQDLALTGDPQAAAARLVILDEGSQRRILSVGATAKVEEYQLTRTVRWRLARGTGDATELIAANELSARRDYRFDPTAVLSKQEEEEALYEQMNADLAQRILFRLQAWASGS